MKKFLFLLIFYMLPIYNLKANPCETLDRNINVNFSTSYGKLTYDFNKTTSQISALAQKYGHKEHSFFAAGLALINVEHEYKMRTEFSKIDGGYCVFPKDLDIFVGFSQPKIYVSNQLKKNTCAYKMVILHEQTHQRINIKTLDYFLPYFYQAAEKIMQEIKPIQVNNILEVKAATLKLTEEFASKFDKILALFKKELALEQSKLDSKSNYSYESSLCRKN